MGRVSTKLISIVQLEEDSKAITLQAAIEEALFNNEFQIKQNLVGICSDNAPNMVSKKEEGGGLANLLQHEIPHLVIIRDFCHNVNLICQEALDTFPVDTLDLVKRICHHFGQSAHRRAHLINVEKEYFQNDQLVLETGKDPKNIFYKCLDTLRLDGHH